MFNFGSDDKEELEENMQEIKGMIQGDKQRQTQEDQGFDGFDDLGSDSDQGNFQPGQQNNQKQSHERNNTQEQASSGQSFGNQDFSGGQQDSLEQNSQSTSQSSQSRSTPSQATSQTDTQPRSEPQRPSQSRNQQASEPQSSADTGISDDFSNPAGDSSGQDSRKEVIRSEPKNPKSKKKPGSDEPLFLREEQFRDVREMIEEMGYLAQELQGNLDDMRDGIRREKENARDVRELVEAYSDRRGEIEESIKKGQK